MLIVPVQTRPQIFPTAFRGLSFTSRNSLSTMILTMFVPSQSLLLDSGPHRLKRRLQPTSPKVPPTSQDHLLSRRARADMTAVEEPTPRMRVLLSYPARRRSQGTQSERSIGLRNRPRLLHLWEAGPGACAHGLHERACVCGYVVLASDHPTWIPHLTNLCFLLSCS